jgi:hypothetical protein
MHPAAGTTLHRWTPSEVFQANRAHYRRYLGRSGNHVQLRAQKQPGNSHRQLKGRCRIEHDSQAHARSVDPARPCDFNQHFAATGPLCRKGDQIVFGQSRVAQAPLDYVGVRIGKEPLDGLAVGPPSQRLAFAEGQRATTFASWQHRRLGAILRRAGGLARRIPSMGPSARVSYQPFQGEQRLADGLLAQSLDEIGHAVCVKGIDHGDQRFSRRGVGLFRTLAERVERVAKGLQRPRSKHAHHVLSAERGISQRKRRPNEGICLNTPVHLVEV